MDDLINRYKKQFTNTVDRQRLNKFRMAFPKSETFYISSGDAARFADEFLMTDDETYGIAVGRTIVENDDHLLKLLGDQDEIAVEFRCVEPQDGQPAADVWRWLRRCVRD